MPKTKNKVSTKSKSSKGFIAQGKFKFDKTLMAVIAVVVVATGGYLFYQGSHASSVKDWETMLRLAPCPYNSAGIPATLRTGSKGTCVSFLQLMLWRGGANKSVIASSGTFDATTKLYVQEFQQENHLSSDGVVGPATWLTLDNCIVADEDGNGYVNVSDLLPFGTKGWRCRRL